MKTGTLSKSENLLIAYLLDERGLLDRMTCQDLADLLGLGHRATAMRLKRSLAEVQKRLPEILARADSISV